MTKHKHYDVIVAFANGETIQEQDWEGKWKDVATPKFHPFSLYRVKPKDRVLSFRVELSDSGEYAYTSFDGQENLRLTFDQATKTLKSAEVI